MGIVYKNFYSVCFLSNETLLMFKRGAFYILDIPSSKFKKIAQIQFSFKEKIVHTLPLMARIFRMGIRCGMKISDDIVLYVLKNKIYELNLTNGSISNGFSTHDKSRPLIFTQIKKLVGFDKGIYFGGYLSNQKRQAVSIYKRVSKDKWNVVYEFPEGKIEHIHNIIADKYSNSVFILTGDFNQAAGIWIAKDNFSSVTPLLLGNQNYRACVAYPTPKGLIYATDTPFTENSIRILINTNEDKWISKKIQTINGPSIYGCEWNDEFIFSTSVEGDGRKQSIFYKLFGRKPGIGVKSDFSCVYKGDLEKGFKEIYRVRKDTMPFFLFQFGVLCFPSGINRSRYLPMFHIATKKHSMSTYIFEE